MLAVITEKCGHLMLAHALLPSPDLVSTFFHYFTFPCFSVTCSRAVNAFILMFLYDENIFPSAVTILYFYTQYANLFFIC